MGHNDHMGVSHFDPHVYSYHYFFFNLYKLTLLTWESKFKGKVIRGAMISSKLNPKMWWSFDEVSTMKSWIRWS